MSGNLASRQAEYVKDGILPRWSRISRRPLSTPLRRVPTDRSGRRHAS